MTSAKGQRRTSCTRLAAGLTAAAMLSGGGCAVVAVVDTVGTVAVKTVGVAADAAIGTVKVAGKVVGKAADVVTGGSGEPKK